MKPAFSVKVWQFCFFLAVGRECPVPCVLVLVGQAGDCGVCGCGSGGACHHVLVLVEQAGVVV